MAEDARKPQRTELNRSYEAFLHYERLRLDRLARADGIDTDSALAQRLEEAARALGLVRKRAQLACASEMPLETFILEKLPDGSRRYEEYRDFESRGGVFVSEQRSRASRLAKGKGGVSHPDASSPRGERDWRRAIPVIGASIGFPLFTGYLAYLNIAERGFFNGGILLFIPLTLFLTFLGIWALRNLGEFMLPDPQPATTSGTPSVRAAAPAVTAHPELEDCNIYGFGSMARKLVALHGPLKRVEFVEHFPTFTIKFEFERHSIISGRRRGLRDINFLSLGYVGEGPTCAREFLEGAGFVLTHAQIANLREGAVLSLAGSTVAIGYPNKPEA